MCVFSDLYSSEYLLYGEPQQLDRWERRYIALDADLSNLTGGSPDRQALITAIREDRGRLKSVFDDVPAQNGTPPQTPADPATLRVSCWSRIGVRTQEVAFDAEMYRESRPSGVVWLEPNDSEGPGCSNNACCNTAVTPAVIPKSNATAPNREKERYQRIPDRHVTAPRIMYRGPAQQTRRQPGPCFLNLL